MMPLSKFDVNILKIHFFRYRNENTQFCTLPSLQRIKSNTLENGKQFRLDGVLDGEVFQLTTHTGDESLPACISTIAYWDKSFLERDRLLNSQTGEYLEIQVRYLGEVSISVRGTRTPAHRYQLVADKASIDLWYSRDDQWLALQSDTRNGSLLRYVIE